MFCNLAMRLQCLAKVGAFPHAVLAVVWHAMRRRRGGAAPSPAQGAEVECAHLADRGSELCCAASAAGEDAVIKHLRLRPHSRVIRCAPLHRRMRTTRPQQRCAEGQALPCSTSSQCCCQHFCTAHNHESSAMSHVSLLSDYSRVWVCYRNEQNSAAAFK